MATTIKLKNSVTTTAAPSSLVQGEVATNITDKKLWVGNAASSPVQLLGAGATVSGTNVTYTGTLTGGTGIVNLGSGQFYKDASGNVIIGTTAIGFAEKFRVYGNYSVFDNGTYTGFIGAGNSLGTGISTDFAFRSSNAMAFLTGGATERMRIDSSGRVLIGSSTAVGSNANLQVIKSSGDVFLVTNDATNYGGFLVNPTSSAVNLYATSGGSVGRPPMAFWTGDTERMRIDSAGNVGIGTSSPSSKLTIASSTGTAEDILSFTTAYGSPSGLKAIAWKDLGTATLAKIGVEYESGNAAITFGSIYASGNNSTERMRIDSSGNLLVGTTTSGTAATGGFALNINGNSSYINIAHVTGTGDGTGYATFGYNGTVIGSITQNGTTGVLYNIVSDQRLKTNIVDASLGNIDDVKVRSFDWKSDGSHVEYGFIAQELVEIAPYAVHQPQNPEEMMAVDYSKLVPMMIKEIQDLKQRIKTLEKK